MSSRIFTFSYNESIDTIVGEINISAPAVEERRILMKAKGKVLSSIQLDLGVH